MLEKLKQVEARFEEVQSMLSDPGVVVDRERFQGLRREYKQLEPIVEKYREYQSVLHMREEAESLLRDESGEMRLLAEQEFYACRDRIAGLEEELRKLLVPRDLDDDRNVVVEIRAGTGGEEAALFAAVLYRMYLMYAQTQGWKVEIVTANETELGGYKEIVFTVEGGGAYARLKFESGVHRVQRVPVTESQGKIQTSAVTVAVLPEAEEIDVTVSPADIRIESIKSTGAGGQHVNKTESAVRLLHIPTGIVVECREERSQFKNRDKAMKLLRTKLLNIKKREQDDRIASQRKTQVGSGDRSERIRTYNYAQGRVTDHRIGMTLYSLDSFLNGQIGGMIDALIAADTAEKLKGMQSEN